MTAALNLLKLIARLLLRRELREGEDRAIATQAALDDAIEDVWWALQGMVPTPKMEEIRARFAVAPTMLEELPLLLEALQREWIQLARVRAAALRLRSRAFHLIEVPASWLEELLKTLEQETEEGEDPAAQVAELEAELAQVRQDHAAQAVRLTKALHAVREQAEALDRIARALDEAGIERGAPPVPRIAILAGQRDDLRKDRDAVRAALNEAGAELGGDLPERVRALGAERARLDDGLLDLIARYKSANTTPYTRVAAELRRLRTPPIEGHRDPALSEDAEGDAA